MSPACRSERASRARCVSRLSLASILRPALSALIARTLPMTSPGLWFQSNGSRRPSKMKADGSKVVLWRSSTLKETARPVSTPSSPDVLKRTSQSKVSRAINCKFSGIAALTTKEQGFKDADGERQRLIDRPFGRIDLDQRRRDLRLFAAADEGEADRRENIGVAELASE